jgi:CRISPR-associated protein Cpf1
LYNQRQEDKNARLPKFTILFKQILSDRTVISWLPEQFADDNAVLAAVRNLYDDLNRNVFNKPEGGNYSLKDLLQNLSDFDLQKVYICNDSGLSDISQRINDDYKLISIRDRLEKENPKRNKEKPEKYAERIEKMCEADSFSMQFISDCLGDSGIVNYFSSFGKTSKNENLLVQIQKNYEAAKDLLTMEYP